MSNVNLTIERNDGSRELRIEWTNETIRWRRAIKDDREIIAIERTFSDLATASVPPPTLTTKQAQKKHRKSK